MKPGSPSRGFVTLRFPDGTDLAGDDFHDVVRRLGHVQWSPVDVPKMKALLSDRAWTWSQTPIDPSLPDREFLYACETAGLFTITTRPAKAPRP